MGCVFSRKNTQEHLGPRFERQIFHKDIGKPQCVKISKLC